MFARGLATRNSLRAFLLAGVILVSGSATQVQASLLGTLTATFNGVITPQNYGGSAGKFSWTANSYTPIIGPAYSKFNSGNNFFTFCIQTTEFISGGNSYTYQIRDDIDALPIPGGGMGIAKAQQLGTLAEIYFATSEDAVTATGVADLSRRNAAFQAAVWSILAGSAIGGTGDGPADTFILAMYNYATNPLNYSGYSFTSIANEWKLLGMASEGPGATPGAQDQIVFYRNPDFLQEVPVPAGVVLAGMGIACMAGANYLRRRKTVATA